ncbi:DUF2252 domain-containing protein [Lacticaseibacillus porcinae]|uniref:DUF2252 domain-containing protein n=1 Tax=Lacticaseibacillus porcinae TaxID=1123687 RepID=UPI003B8320B3
MINSLISDILKTPLPVGVDQRRALGKKQRDETPISALGHRPVITRSAPHFIHTIESHLIAELLPMRHQRMLAGPAAFFRGTAELMAYDLRHEVNSGIEVLSSGDAHLQNFGFYASPERQLLFDLNDFDEAAVLPFEYDVKRLATSVYLLGAQMHFDADQMDTLVKQVVRIYRKSLKTSFKQTQLERFYTTSEVHALIGGIDAKAAGLIDKIVTKAKSRDQASVIKKYTQRTASGQLRFKVSPPRSIHVEADTEVSLMQGLLAYRETTRADVNLLLHQYHVTDMIRHSVGIGSFGTHCYLVLLMGPNGSSIVLQIKEALPDRHHLSLQTDSASLQSETQAGQRIIAATQILQKASDPFLGWMTIGKRSFYVRQFRDMKESVDVTKLNFEQFQAYSEICAQLLAKAHAQSPQAAVICGYLNKDFDAVIQSWCLDYLHQVVNDFAAFAGQFE